MLTRKQAFGNAYLEAGGDQFVTKMVVAIKLPTGATELIINTEQISSKFEYYMNAYDEKLCLKANKDIQIIGYLFA